MRRGRASHAPRQPAGREARLEVCGRLLVQQLRENLLLHPPLLVVCDRRARISIALQPLRSPLVTLRSDGGDAGRHDGQLVPHHIANGRWWTHRRQYRRGALQRGSSWRWTERVAAYENEQGRRLVVESAARDHVVVLAPDDVHDRPREAHLRHRGAGRQHLAVGGAPDQELAALAAASHVRTVGRHHRAHRVGPGLDARHLQLHADAAALQRGEAHHVVS
mmetsp:Transcript_84959/g.218851  ORF Transcript_84959/g.218851 Transcript_84959/m.218851 type:complete len:221 (-) Transcript_84959:680-1342(-)